MAVKWKIMFMKCFLHIHAKLIFFKVKCIHSELGQTKTLFSKSLSQNFIIDFIIIMHIGCCEGHFTCA